MNPTRSATALGRLLDQRNEHPERIPAIDRAIRDRFERRHAVLVLDMCGFSRLTLRHGIIHFLSMIRRMNGLVRPIIAAAGGKVVKAEADNVFAIFGDVPPALAAARTINADLRRHNQVMPEDWDVHVSIGIGYGDLLMVGTHDFYGAEVNLASKLGEDIAGPGEVLLTASAWARAGRAGTQMRRGRERMGGVPVTYYAFPP